MGGKSHALRLRLYAPISPPPTKGSAAKPKKILNVLVQLQAISDARLGLEKFWLVGIILEFLPQLGDINPEVMGVFLRVRPPKFPQNLLMRDHPIAMDRKIPQQIVLFGRQFHLLAAPPHDVGDEIDLAKSLLDEASAQ